MRALGVHHDAADIRDTALLPKFLKPDGGSRKLKELASMYLDGSVIQEGLHDPEEAAKTTMKLYKRHWDLPGITHNS